MAKNPREPKAVKKLIADATENQIERGVFAYLKRVAASAAAARRNNGGGGTRKNPR